MLMIEGGGVAPFMRFSSAIKPPKVVEVSAQAAISMEALGADALAHSASRIASASFGEMTPGVPQLFGPPEGAGWTCINEAVYPARPKVERKVLQSEEVNTSVSSINTMVCPWPEVPALKSRFRL